ncbi:MAG: hypothetical protein U1D55_12215 [Phycisphaerae bacterium]
MDSRDGTLVRWPSDVFPAQAWRIAATCRVDFWNTNLPSAPNTVAPAQSLRTNITYALAGEVFFNLCRLGVVVLLAKFTSAEILGQFDYSLAISAPVVLFCSLQLKPAFVSDVTGAFPFGAYRALRTIGMIGAALALAAFVAWKARIDRDPALSLILLGVAFGKIAHCSAELYWGVFQKRERIDLAARSSLLRGAAMLACVALCVPVVALATRGDLHALARSTAAAVITYAALWWVVLWAHDRPIALQPVGKKATSDDASRRGVITVDDLRWTWPMLGRLLRQTLPLGVVLLLISLYESAPRYSLEALPGGKALLGYFSAMSYVALASSLILTQICVASANRIATYFQHDRRAFRRLAGRLLAIAVIMGVVLIIAAWLAGAWFLRTLYRPEYAAFSREFVLLIVAQAFVLLANVLGFFVTYMRMFWIQVPVQLTVLIVTLVTAQMWIVGSGAGGSLDPAAVRGCAMTVLARAATQAGLLAICAILGSRRRPTISVG